MALIGLQTDTHNPEYTVAMFTVWMPQFRKFLETQDGIATWDVVYPIANGSIFKSVFGNKWSYAMALMIAHFFTLIAMKEQAPAGETLSSIAGGGATKGVISTATVGGFSVSYETDKTMIDEENAKWYNLTSYGAELYALMKTRHIPAIFVVTSNDIEPPRKGYPYGK